jgi:hypothetical protein
MDKRRKTPLSRYLLKLLLTFIPLSSLSSFAENTGSLPWLSVSGESRVRVEALDRQFRAEVNGGDQLLLFRTLLHAEVKHDPLKLGIELQDSRTYFGDSGTPLSNGISNPLDILQLYGEVKFGGHPATGSSSTLRLGRQTISIGSKRQIERISFANVIKSYTGIYYSSTTRNGHELHAFAVVPVGRFPKDKESLLDNETQADEEEGNRLLWGIHYRHANYVAGFPDKVWGEVFIYGLHENDSGMLQTPNRQYLTPGFRFFRKRHTGHWDFDLEAALRIGTRRASSSDLDTTDLDVFASMLYATIGSHSTMPGSPDSRCSITGLV